MTIPDPETGGMSRRSLIGAGAALGVGAAMPKWTWSAANSIAAVGSVPTPPWEVWDDLADPVIASVIERGDAPLVNELLRGWRNNSDPLPAGLPSDVREFMEEAKQLPPWVNMTELQRAVDFNKRRGTYLGVAYGFVSGMMSALIPHEALAVYYSKGGADMKDRISKTAKFGYDIGSPGAFHQPTGQMIVTCVKTRMAHAGVRYLLPHSPTWAGKADEVGGRPISQRDILVTWHSLPTSVIRAFQKWGVRSSPSDYSCFLHSWQVAAYMLGVKEEYIPNSWPAAEAQAQQVLDPILAPTPEGIELARILTRLAANVDGGIITQPLLESITRTFLGTHNAAMLQIPRHKGQDELMAAAWPIFVGVKEGSLRLWPWTAKHFWWFFDELLRQGALAFLAEGNSLNITIPTGNNPHYPDNTPSPGGGTPPPPPAPTYP